MLLSSRPMSSQNCVRVWVGVLAVEVCKPTQGSLCCGSGFQALVLTALLVGLGVSVGLPLGALPGMLLPLAFATTLTSFIFSLLLYAKALVAPASALAPGGNSGEKGPSEVGVRWVGCLPVVPSLSIVPQEILCMTSFWDGS